MFKDYSRSISTHLTGMLRDNMEYRYGNEYHCIRRQDLQYHTDWDRATLIAALWGVYLERFRSFKNVELLIPLIRIYCRTGCDLQKITNNIVLAGRLYRFIWAELLQDRSSQLSRSGMLISCKIRM